MIYVIDNSKKNNTYIINKLSDIINILKIKDTNIHNISDLIKKLDVLGYSVACYDSIEQYYVKSI